MAAQSTPMASGMIVPVGELSSPEQGMLVDPDVAKLAARVEAMTTDGTTASVPLNDDAGAIDGTVAKYDLLDDVWRCSECFWEVALGNCEHCGRVATNRDDMAQHDQQLELANPSYDQTVFAPQARQVDVLETSRDLTTSQVNSGETLTARERLAAAGVPDWMVDEFDMSWDDVDGAVLTLPGLDLDIECWAPDGFAWTTIGEGGRVVQSSPVNDIRAPEEWRIALGHDIELVSDNIAAVSDYIEEVLEIMLTRAEAYTYDLKSRRAAQVKGKKEDAQPITLLVEPADSAAYAYTRCLRSGEYLAEGDDGCVRLQLVDESAIPVIQPFIFEDDDFSDLDSRQEGDGSSEEEEAAVLTDGPSGGGDSDGGETNELLPELDDDMEFQPEEAADGMNEGAGSSHVADDSYSPMKM